MAAPISALAVQQETHREQRRELSSPRCLVPASPSLSSKTRVVLLLGFAEQKAAFCFLGRVQKMTPWERASSEI